MEPRKFLPSDPLKPYIKHYWIYTAAADTFETIYPSGYLELAVNISGKKVTTIIDNRSIKMPNVEVLGQLTLPGSIQAAKGTSLIVTRFYPYACSLFFPNQSSDFTNDSVDLGDVYSREANELHHRMMECPSLEQKISALDLFLIQRLKKNTKKQERSQLVEKICRHISHNKEFSRVEHLATYYGVSDRYIQKLFLDVIGITPKTFSNIQRFNKSLELVRESNLSLTSIAYECGYYDQAHFIKEFKTFTGISPSQHPQRTEFE